MLGVHNLEISIDSTFIFVAYLRPLCKSTQEKLATPCFLDVFWSSKRKMACDDSKNIPYLKARSLTVPHCSAFIKAVLMYFVQKS